MENKFKTILTASYPLLDSNEVLKIAIYAPINEPLPGKEELIESLEISEDEAEEWLTDIKASELAQPSRRVYWTLSAPEYTSEKKYSVGVDDLQAVLLAMQSIAQEIREWETESCMKCEFTFSEDINIIYSPRWQDDRL